MRKRLLYSMAFVICQAVVVILFLTYVTHYASYTEPPASTSQPYNGSAGIDSIHDATSPTSASSVPLMNSSKPPNIALNQIDNFIQSHMVTSQGIKLKWISLRMKKQKESWEAARDALLKKSPELFSHPKKILIFPGLLQLSKRSGYDFAVMAFKGGFLGELTQWSDLIAVLILLGHELYIATSLELLLKYRPADIQYDVLFTDYIGMSGVHKARLMGQYKCRIRILDSFGTEPLYSFRTKSFLMEKREMFTAWDIENLQQLWTLYPHTPDNSFLGFAMELPNVSVPHSQRKNQAVIYGKKGKYFKKQFGQFLTVIGEEIELHATVNSMPKGFPSVIKHGVLTPKDLKKLLQESRLFIGLGFPYEGPGPMEAIANGCAYIQPKFIPPRNKYNDDVMRGKPTARFYNSQVPYLEDYVGEPYVYTVDSGNSTEIRAAVRKILKTANFSSFLPYEFTQLGMMERVGQYILHQNFCDLSTISLMKTATSSSGNSVKAIDGVETFNSCYRSGVSQEKHWWMVELYKIFKIGRIKITLAYDWILAKNFNPCQSVPFQVTILDSKHSPLLHQDYHDCRLSYELRNLNVSGMFVKIETLNITSVSELVLCSVEVFPSYRSSRPIWPGLEYLRAVIGNPGQSCADVCYRNKMICEPSFFEYLNNQSVVMNYFNCLATHELTETYIDYAPAIAVKNDTKLSIISNECIISNIKGLMGCAGHSEHFKRLCPCRNMMRGQIALVPPTPIRINI